jgi:hypothetical protein
LAGEPNRGTLMLVRVSGEPGRRPIVRAMLRRWSPLVLLVAIALSGCSGDEPSSGTAAAGNYSLEQARAFEDFPLYAPGEAHDDLPLTAVVRRFEDSPNAPPVRENYVDFIYGTCDTSAGGCAPPLSVQVWAACERNPMAYGPDEAEGPFDLRGVPAYFFEGGRRLELSTGTSTVVIFSTGRDAALSAANALEGINNQVPAGTPLPPPAYTTEQNGGTSVLPCPYEDPKQLVKQDPTKAAAVARALERRLAASARRGDNKGVRAVECFRSGVFEPVASVDDFHTCAITSGDGSGESWCVFSSGAELYSGSLPTSCEEAAGGDLQNPAEQPPAEVLIGDAELAWGAHAQAACLPWRDKEVQAIAELDQDLLYEDLSYIWFQQRPYEAGIVRDLRAIPGRTGAARRAVSVYELRLAGIDAGLSAWQKDRKARALEHFRSAEATSDPLSGLFARLHADACAPA